MGNVRSISSLRPRYNRVTIRVHILRAWSRTRRPSLELLFRDLQGNTVEASTVPEVIARFAGIITESVCYDVFDFEVVQRYDRSLSGWWSLADCPFRLLITDKTIITRVRSVPPYYLSLHNSFYNFVHSELPQNPLTVHLVGCIVGVRVDDNGSLIFVIKDLGGLGIVGNASGSERIAMEIQRNWQSSDREHLTCEFRFWSLIMIEGHLYLNTLGEKSDVAFDVGEIRPWSVVLASGG